MKKFGKSIAIFTICLFVTISLSTNLNAQTKSGLKTVKPEVLPVHNLIRAVLASDFRLYKSVWTTIETDRSKLSKKNWREVRTSELERLRKGLGDFEFNKIKFDVEDLGDNKYMKRIYVSSENQEGIEYTVVKEDDKWKCFILPVSQIKYYSILQ